MSSGKVIRIIFLVIGVCLALYIALATPFENLSAKGSVAAAIFLVAVCMWITDFVPDYVTSLAMMTAWVLFGTVPATTSFAAFSGSTVWLLIGAFGLATAVGKSGLLNRLALTMMVKFPMTFKGQTFGMLLTSLIIGPLVPSAVSKGAILGPLAKSISDNLGYERQSKGANGLFAAMLIPTAILYVGFLSATFMNYMILGMMPEAYREMMSWTRWLISAGVWTVIVGAVTYIFVLIYYRPENAGLQGNKEDLIKQKNALGSMKKNEIIVTIVLIVCIILWILEKRTGLSSMVVTLTGVVVLLATNVVERTDFRNKIPWDMVIFIGGVLCCGPVFKATGIDTFFSTQLGPLVTPVMEANFIGFLVIYAIFIYLAKFLIVSQTAVLTIFFVALAPIAVSLNINPWIIGFVTYSANGIWLTKYQNPTYIPLLAMVSGSESEKALVLHRQTVPLTLCFMIINIIGYIASVPLWKALGYFQPLAG